MKERVISGIFIFAATVALGLAGGLWLAAALLLVSVCGYLELTAALGVREESACPKYPD